MPQKIPFSVLLLGLVKKCISGLRVAFSLSFATILWFLAVPIITSHIFRYYFGWSLQGLFNSAFPVEELNDNFLETSLTILFDVIQGFLLTGFSVFLILGMMLVREFISMIRRPEPRVNERVSERASEIENITNVPSIPESQNLRSPLSPNLLSPPRRHSEARRPVPLSPNTSVTATGNFWLDQVHPKEYRNYIRRRELHRDMTDEERNNNLLAQDSETLFGYVENEELPEDHVSNISGTSTLRSRFTTTNSTTITNGPRESFRCRICLSNTCINRDHVIQASQIRNNLTAQRHRSLLQRSSVPGNTETNDVTSTVSVETNELPSPPTPAVNTAEQEVLGWNLDAADSISFPEFFGFTREGTPVLELLQNSALAIGCNTLIMHLFLFIPFITGRAFLNGTFIKAAGKILESFAFLVLKPNLIEKVSDFIQYKILASKFLFSLQFNKYIKLFIFKEDSVIYFLFNLIIGYSMLCSIFSIYFKFTNNLKDSFHRVFIPVARFLGTFIKLISLLFIEMAIFPVMCGFFIDYFCLDLFPGIKFYDRLEGLKLLPISSITVHWALGAFFMISFGSFVTFLRSFLRPGLLFFLRNPQDPDNHPVKEMVDRGFFDQIYRLTISSFFYLFLIFSSIGLTIKSLTIPSIHSRIFPLNFKISDPLLEIPIDIFLQLILRIIWKSFSPEKILKNIFMRISKIFISKLNLSSYFLGGGRYLSEESFPRGGKWVPVPNFDKMYERDRIKEIRSRSVTPIDISKLKIVSDKEGNPIINDSSNARGNISDWTPVFRPNYFKFKCFLIILMTISLIQFYLFTLMTFPLISGRFLLSLLIDSTSSVNDIYSWSLGSFVILLTLKVFELKDQKIQIILNLNNLSKFFKFIIKSLIFGFFCFILWPLQVGILFSLTINPILTTVAEEGNLDQIQIIYFISCWSIGFPILRLLYSLKDFLPFLPERTRISLRNFRTLYSWTIFQLLNNFIIPITLIFTGILVLPPITSFILNSDPKIQKYSHLTALSTLLILKLSKSIFKSFNNMIIGIRDETYLIGRRLHNLENRTAPTLI